MTPIIQIQFGSHLYGTATPQSDLDYKSVFVPSAREILLQRAPVQTSNRRSKAEGERNAAGDIDLEAFALHRYLNLLSAGQPLALDMLFAPGWAMVGEPSPIWATIIDNRSQLISRKTAEFVTYCQRQAKKYGIKGSRVHSLRNVLEWFDGAIAEYGLSARLEVAAGSLTDFIFSRQLDHAEIVLLPHVGREPVPHLECCERKASFFATLKDSRAIYQRMMDNYGVRSLQAETNQNVDWKAVSHAVRIGSEALEFLTTGWITFPRPDAARLRAIKAGLIPYRQLADEIEQAMLQVKAAQDASTLPDEPNYTLIDDIVCNAYANAVREWRT